MTVTNGVLEFEQRVVDGDFRHLLGTVMAARTELTAERLRELLHYNPLTGEWTWLVNRRGPMKAGAEAGTIAFLPSGPRRQIGVDGRDYLASRLAYLYMKGEWPPATKPEIDHKNLNTLDDCWENLRPANRSGQTANSTQPRTKHHDLPRGVQKTGKNFRAELTVNGRKINGPSRATIAEAEADRIALEKRYQGEFALPRAPRSAATSSARRPSEHGQTSPENRKDP